MKESPGKILIIVENLPLPFDRRVWMESNTLRKEGYEIFIICPKGKGYDKDYEKINDINIYRHPLPPEKSSALGYLREYSHALFYEWKLARKIYKEHKFNVIQACNPPDFIFLVALWFKVLYKVKFVFDHHDLNPELYESKFNKRGFFYYFLKVAERLTFMSTDMVMSTNESYKEVAITRGHVEEDKVHVVRSGPDLSIFNLKPADNTYKKGRKFLVGYLGVMGEFDGVDHFIKAIGIIVNEIKRKDIQFCLIGSGPCFEDLKKLSTNLGINEYVEFTGRISDEELLNRLSTCEVCVNADPLNPLNDKSTMNKILEYMALSKPIVQYDLIEGKRSAGEASLYAIPNDINDFAKKIIGLIDDEDKRIRMGRIGRKRMEDKLEWNHQSKKLINAYHNLFNQN
jgi:glycosyltransferase involved in cell wall biosynthesis